MVTENGGVRMGRAMYRSRYQGGGVKGGERGGGACRADSEAPLGGSVVVSIMSVASKRAGTATITNGHRQPVWGPAQTTVTCAGIYAQGSRWSGQPPQARRQSTYCLLPLCLPPPLRFSSKAFRWQERQVCSTPHPPFFIDPRTLHPRAHLHPTPHELAPKTGLTHKARNGLPQSQPHPCGHLDGGGNGRAAVGVEQIPHQGVDQRQSAAHGNARQNSQQQQLPVV